MATLRNVQIRAIAAMRSGKASPKSKGSEPWMARPICMDAGFLCDRAGLFWPKHQLKATQPILIPFQHQTDESSQR